MSKNSFVDFVIDQLSEFEAIEFKRMFGGFGLYSNSRIFGIIADNQLYFKANKQTEKFYVEYIVNLIEV